MLVPYMDLYSSDGWRASSVEEMRERTEDLDDDEEEEEELVIKDVWPVAI